MDYNLLHGITPMTVKKERRATISEIISSGKKRGKNAAVKQEKNLDAELCEIDFSAISETDAAELIAELTKDMLAAAESLEFERAAALRDRIKSLQGK